MSMKKFCPNLNFKHFENSEVIHFSKVKELSLCLKLKFSYLFFLQPDGVKSLHI